MVCRRQTVKVEIRPIHVEVTLHYEWKCRPHGSCILHILERFESVQERFIVRNAFLNITYDAAFIDEVGNPSPTVEFLYTFFCVGNERERDTILL